MANQSELTALDWDVRLYIYEFFVQNERPPQVAETAAAFQVSAERIRTVYGRLNHHHALFLEPDRDEIRMAHPLSAVPTRYRVYVDERAYWANCGWDALGIPAMLNSEARIEATCPDCEETVTLWVRDGAVSGSEERVHFALPFRAWYEDLILT